ncbi:MAG: nuclear transport factor 2 family protein [Peptostreptococcaceae bacterium]|nr:nuclear transport factor 2 family protein [Peptostreptococcaceae bacterium]
MEELLLEFFDAENRRDWEKYKQFLHPEVIWKLYGAPNKEIAGIEQYMETMMKAYENTDVQFSCEDMKVSSDKNRIVAYLVNDFGIRSVDVFDFKDNLIYREYEFILE